MDSVAEELLNRYEIIVADKIAIQNENLNHISKEKALTIQLEDLSRTVTILKKTIECHEDFLCEMDLRNDYETFKNKWLEKEN